jgi:hypothetical protein
MAVLLDYNVEKAKVVSIGLTNKIFSIFLEDFLHVFIWTDI